MGLLITCSECGSSVSGDVRFCGNCGARTGADQATNGGAPQTMHTQPYQAPAYQGAQPVQQPYIPAQPYAPAGMQTPVQAAPAPAVSDKLSPEQAQRVGRVVGLLALTALIVGVSAGYLTGGPANAKDIVAQLPIGPEGGTIDFENGGKVQVPPGAMSSTEPVTVYRTVVERQVTVNRGPTPFVFPPGTLVVYSFGPFDLRFLRPVTIVLPLPRVGVNGIVFVIVNGQLRFVGGTPNAGNGTITIQVRDFRFSGLSQAVG